MANEFVARNGFIALDATTITGSLKVFFNNQTMDLIGTDHTYVAFYPDGPATRKAYLGFAGAADDNFTMANEISNSHIYLLTAGTGGVNARNSLSVGNITPSTTQGRIDASNDIVAFSTSDARLKTNVENIQDSISKVSSLNGVTFDWISEHKQFHGYEGHDVGVIAQEIQQVLPEAVRTNDTGYLSVRYEKIIPLLIEAIKEQQKQIDELKTKLDAFTK